MHSIHHLFIEFVQIQRCHDRNPLKKFSKTIWVSRFCFLHGFLLHKTGPVGNFGKSVGTFWTRPLWFQLHFMISGWPSMQDMQWCPASPSGCTVWLRDGHDHDSGKQQGSGCPLLVSLLRGTHGNPIYGPSPTPTRCHRGWPFGSLTWPVPSPWVTMRLTLTLVDIYKLELWYAMVRVAYMISCMLWHIYSYIIKLLVFT